MKEVLMKEVLIELKKISKLMLEDDEIFDLAAQLFKKSHSALIKAGFTEEQATTIIAGQGTGVKFN